MIKTILITGANAGLGKESARQFALQPGIEKVYLGVRNTAKGEAAKKELEAATQKRVFEVFEIDVADLNSCQKAISNLSAPLDAIVMNAGGMSVENTMQTNEYGVLNMYAVNMLGHSYFLHQLLEQKKLTGVALYVGTEGARGLKGMAPKPDLGDFSESIVESVIDGSYAPNKKNQILTYGSIKLIGAMWMSALSRKHENIKFLTVSPGGTKGTNAFKNASLPMRILSEYMVMPLLGLMGKVHNVEAGALRFVDAVMQDKYESGVFYASKNDSPIGALADQVTFLPGFYTETYQENVYRVVHGLIKKAEG